MRRPPPDDDGLVREAVEPKLESVPKRRGRIPAFPGAVLSAAPPPVGFNGSAGGGFSEREGAMLETGLELRYSSSSPNLRMTELLSSSVVLSENMPEEMEPR